LAAAAAAAVQDAKDKAVEKAQELKDAAVAKAAAVKAAAQEAVQKAVDAATAAVEATLALAQQAKEWAKEKADKIRNAQDQLNAFLLNVWSKRDDLLDDLSDVFSENRGNDKGEGLIGCPTGGDLLAAGLDQITGYPNVGLPIFDWKAMTEAVLKPSLGDNFGDKTYAELERNGMPGDITFVQQVAMPPNAWTGSAGKGTVAELNVHFTDKNLEAEWKAQSVMALPIAHYSTKETSGWMMNEDITSLSVTVHKENTFMKFLQDVPTVVKIIQPQVAAAAGVSRLAAAADCETTTEIVLPTAPTVNEVTAASSAAMGWLSSPTLLRAQKWWPRGPGGNWLTQCTAATIKNFAVPMRGMVDEDTFEGELSLPTYRFIDGAFVDNTGLAATIGKLHADDPDAKHLGKVIHFDLDSPFWGEGEVRPLRKNIEARLQNRVAALFSMSDAEDGAPPCNTPSNDNAGLCIDSDAPGQKNAKTVGRPVSVIFENNWPDEAEWTEYAAHTDCIDQKGKETETERAECTKTTIRSYYWKGAMKTVENKWYGVPAGLELQLLVFAFNEATDIKAVAATPESQMTWGTIYGPIAQEQADGAEPVIKCFLSQTRDDITEENAAADGLSRGDNPTAGRAAAAAAAAVAAANNGGTPPPPVCHRAASPGGGKD